MSATTRARRELEGGALLEAARALAPEIEAAGGEIDAAGALPPALVGRLVEAGMFRAALPRSVGGAELDLLSFLELAQTLAAADGSVGWCFVQGAFSAAQVVGYLPAETAQEVFGDERTVLANGTAGEGTAVADPSAGGYRVTGRWPFASGCLHATWYKAAAVVVGASGEAVATPGGGRELRTFLLPADPAHVEHAWQVSGLRGTGSHAIVLRDVFVPAARSALVLHDPLREAGALYRLPYSGLAAAGFSAVAMGIARGALDAFVALAARKAPRGTREALRGGAVVQDKTARAEAQLRGARAFLREAAGEAWDVVGAGDVLSARQRALLRLASTHGSHQAAGVVDAVYHAAGATAIFEEGAFARRFRDVHAVTQQIQSQDRHFQAVGRVLLGLPAESDYV